jgi:hypothetical protein
MPAQSLLKQLAGRSARVRADLIILNMNILYPRTIVQS